MLACKKIIVLAGSPLLGREDLGKVFVVPAGPKLARMENLGGVFKVLADSP